METNMTDARNAGSDRNVVLTGIDVPFGQLVVYLIKLALAAIPALVVLWLALQLVWLVVAAVMGYPFRPWRRWDW
jgi:predicted membrane channel-forming protein YqfA (hemolysin III family)